MNCSRIIQRCVHLMYNIRNSSTITIPALIDSYPIEATLFEPSSSTSSDSICVVISEATSSRRQFYFSFARYLSEIHNMHVITYDYRGTHDRRPTEWTLVDHWARRDCAGVLSYCFQKYNQVVHVGHSLGGNLHAFLPSSINEQLTRILLVSSANSYVMNHKWNPAFLRTCFLLYVIREPVLWKYGYYPGRTLLRAGVDIPSNIIRQWARWTSHRQCFVDDNGQLITEGFNSVKCPILALNFEDDEFYTRRAFDIFTDQFHQSSNKHSWHLPKGGHFNFFKEKQSSELWKDVARFLKYGDTSLPTVNK
jgi:predicted alpha/beta hydrolase